MAQSRILLVEDDPLIRQLLVEVLRDERYDVLEAAGGEAAARLLETAGEIDLLLTDVHMPGGHDGIELARIARARHPALPLIFATGRPDRVRDFGELGPLDVVLVKPFSPRQMLAALRDLLPARPAPS